MGFLSHSHRLRKPRTGSQALWFLKPEQSPFQKLLPRKQNESTHRQQGGTFCKDRDQRLGGWLSSGHTTVWMRHFLSIFSSITWRRKWQPTPVLVPGAFHGRRRLLGYSPWGRKESDTTARLSLIHHLVRDSRRLAWDGAALRWAHEEGFAVCSCQSFFCSTSAARALPSANSTDVRGEVAAKSQSWMSQSSLLTLSLPAHPLRMAGGRRNRSSGLSGLGKALPLFFIYSSPSLLKRKVEGTQSGLGTLNPTQEMFRTNPIVPAHFLALQRTVTSIILFIGGS